MKTIKLFFILWTMCIWSITTKAQVLFQCDFKTEEQFNQFTTYDLDGNKPVISDWFGSTPPYKAWAWIGGAAASTSWYDPAGKSNDWLISPAITIPEGTDAVLIWSGFSDSNNGYKIYVSNGNTPTDFTEKPVFSIDAENKTITRRSVSLSQYAGKTIYIAWVNDSFDRGWELFVYDILVCSNTYFTFNMEAPQYLSNEDNPQIKIQLHNYSNTITSFTANYTIDGQTYSQKYDNLNIGKDSDYNFEIGNAIQLNPGHQANYEVWITTDAYETPKQEGTTARLATIFPRKVVAILNTGTWCPWSPAGTVYINYMKEHYPDSFIAFAAHDGDPMQLFDYFSYGGTYPSAYFNSTWGIQIDPENFESEYKKEINKYTPAKISLSAEFTDNSKKRIKVNTQTEFAINTLSAVFTNTFFTIDLIITENNVSGTDQGYNQANAYSGGAFGPMGGYENLPNPIPASQMEYQDVERIAIKGYDLANYGLFSTISTGNIYDFSFILELPSNIKNADNIEITALLRFTDYINGDDEIVNASRVKPSMGSSDSFIQINNPEPGNENSSGKIELSIPVPTDASISNGQFSLQLPDGINVDEVKTSSENSYALNAWKLSNGNIWQFNIIPENLRSATTSSSEKVLQIFYTVPESIGNGDYQAQINNLSIKFSDESIIGEQTHSLNITVDHSYSGISYILQDAKINVANNILYLNTPVTERISIYSPTGNLLLNQIKSIGVTQISLDGIKDKILLIKGSSGWVKKLIH